MFNRYIFNVLFIGLSAAFSFGETPVIGDRHYATKPLTGGGVIVVDDFPNCVSFSPNPSDDFIIYCETLDGEDVIQSLVVRTLTGTFLLSENCAESTCTIDVSSLSEGEYRLIVTTAGCSNNYVIEVTKE